MKLVLSAHGRKYSFIIDVSRKIKIIKNELQARTSSVSRKIKIIKEELQARTSSVSLNLDR